MRMRAKSPAVNTALWERRLTSPAIGVLVKRSAQGSNAAFHWQSEKIPWLRYFLGSQKQVYLQMWLVSLRAQIKA